MVQASRAGGNHWFYYYEPEDRAIHYMTTGYSVPDHDIFHNDVPFFPDIDKSSEPGGEADMGQSENSE